MTDDLSRLAGHRRPSGTTAKGKTTLQQLFQPPKRANPRGHLGACHKPQRAVRVMLPYQARKLDWVLSVSVMIATARKGPGSSPNARMKSARIFL